MEVQTATEIQAFHDWLKAHPTPASRYRGAGKKASMFTVPLFARSVEDIDGGDGGDDGDVEDDTEKHIYDTVLKHPTGPSEFVHCTVRETVRADHGSEFYTQWDQNCYRFERISFQSIRKFLTTPLQREGWDLAAKNAKHGDVFTTGENGDYRGTSNYIFYGTPSELHAKGGDAALIKTGREMGEAIPPEFYDAPSGYYSEVLESREEIMNDVLPPPSYLVRCDQFEKICQLWATAAGCFTDGKVCPVDEDDAEVGGYKLAPFKRSICSAVAARDPERDGFLFWNEEEGDADKDTLSYFGPRPRFTALLRELMLMPTSSASGADVQAWWSGLTAVDRATVYWQRNSGSRRDRESDDDDDEEDDDESDESEKPKPKKNAAASKKAAPKKKAAGKKKAAAASSSSSSSSSDDDDDDDSEDAAPAKKKPAAKAKKASPKKKAGAAAAAAAAGAKWQFRADLDADSDDDDAWGDYDSEVSATIETKFQEYEAATAAQKKAKKRKEVDVSKTHYVSFEHMMQFAKADFNKQRGVRRVE